MVAASSAPVVPDTMMQAMPPWQVVVPGKSGLAPVESGFGVMVLPKVSRYVYQNPLRPPTLATALSLSSRSSINTSAMLPAAGGTGQAASAPPMLAPPVPVGALPAAPAVPVTVVPAVPLGAVPAVPVLGCPPLPGAWLPPVLLPGLGSTWT